MITIEQIEKTLGDNNTPYKTKDVDHDVLAISLLRKKIPYDSCKSIIQGAEHDILYLCDIDEVMEHLSLEDLEVLADCNVWYNEEHGSLALFV